MLPRQLKYFLAVVETGSFTEAAAQCLISQSAVSQQIQALERARLLVAGGKGYLPVEGIPSAHAPAAPPRRIPLPRDGEPIPRNYRAFWRVDNRNPYIREFFEILKGQFP